ncbi:MAG: peptidoglycan editing factor PgeF [Oscillospiraceae bacterium]|nr:peptidoglycan editing factor PgeF [Oscillospiraceae bacterium]
MAFIEKNVNGVVFTVSTLLRTPHAFTTRLGGVSSGIFSSLDLAENRGDDEENVRENNRRVCAACGFDPDRIVFTRQVHGNVVRPVTGRDVHTLFTPVPYEADGLATAEPGLALTVFTADCVPILLFDERKNVAATVHAGWRGTAADIAGRGVALLAREYGSSPADIRAAIGTSIGFCCFETDADVPDALRAALGNAAERFIRTRGSKYLVDLKGANRTLLMRAGVPAENVDVSGECTMCLPDRYWSHRYTHGERGSMAGFISVSHEKRFAGFSCEKD